MKKHIVLLFLSLCICIFLITACKNGINEDINKEIETPTEQLTSTVQPDSTERHYISITCPDPNQPLTVIQSGSSWKYKIEGTVFPNDIPNNLTVNIVYQRIGQESTDFTFVYGRGAKVHNNGDFSVDGWIGDSKFPPKDGEKISITIILVDEKIASGFDKARIKSLKDIPNSGYSSEIIYTLSTNEQDFCCNTIGLNYDRAPETAFTVNVTCPSNQLIFVDKMKDTWRYSIGGNVNPTQIPDNLTVNVIYKRDSKEATNWIFIDSGGIKPFSDGQFLVEGFIGNKQHPVVPGEKIDIVLAFVDETKASDFDNLTKIDPYMFDADFFSSSISYQISDNEEEAFRCRYEQTDSDQPLMKNGYTMSITCPVENEQLTVELARESWRFYLGGTFQPLLTDENLALFVAYKRIEAGTDWILIDKPATPFDIPNTNLENISQFRAEGWIGNAKYPPIYGEEIAVAVVLMEEAEGRQLGNATFRTLEQIDATAFSVPTYVTINNNNEEKHHCTGAELPESTNNPINSNPFMDEMETKDTNFWQIADGWTNESPFWVGWRSDHIEFTNGIMRLRLDDKPCSSNASNCSGQPYASAEYRTNELFQYGCISGRIKAASESGVITSLFTYTGPSDGNPHDEIDIEILGNDTTQMQVNYYTDGVGHEHMVDLGFDAAEEFHTYAFEWSEETIKWYVDGELVHTEDGSNGALPITPGKIMMNLWPVDDSLNHWAGEFVYPEAPIYAEYDWVQYTPSKCMGVDE